MSIADLKVDSSGKFYVTKRVPEDIPIFEATLPANEGDVAEFLSQFEKVSGASLTLTNFPKVPFAKILEV